MHHLLPFRLVLLLSILLALPGATTGTDTPYDQKVKPWIGLGGDASRPGGWLSADGAQMCWIPEGVTTCRGILLTEGAHGMGLYEAARLWGFALVRGMVWNLGRTPAAGAERSKANLAEFAERTGHPELVNAPVVVVGESRTGNFAMDLPIHWPGRVIAFAVVTIGGSRNHSAENMKVPGLFIPSEKDNAQIALDNCAAGRAKGALWACGQQWGRRHGMYDAFDLILPCFDQSIALRLPADADARKAPPVLRDLREEDGWLGDWSQWTDWCSIAAYKDFTGDRKRAAWMPNRYCANVWRAFAAATPALKLESPCQPWNHQGVGYQDSSLTTASTFAITASGGTGALQFWDGDVLLGEGTGTLAGARIATPGIRAIFVSDGKSTSRAGLIAIHAP